MACGLMDWRGGTRRKRNTRLRWKHLYLRRWTSILLQRVSSANSRNLFGNDGVTFPYRQQSCYTRQSSSDCANTLGTLTPVMYTCGDVYYNIKHSLACKCREVVSSGETNFLQWVQYHRKDK